jgi:hypothetical protein
MAAHWEDVSLRETNAGNHEVIGRIEDGYLTVDEWSVSMGFCRSTHIQMGQIIQEDLNRIRVKVVPTPGFDSKDVEEIVLRVQQRLGNKVEVIVEQVTNIPLTAAGKYKAVISVMKNRGIEDVEQTGI